MKKVMIFGTFDGLHPGHESLFAQASEHGDWVIAVVARDATVQRVKGRLPLRDEADRLAELLSHDLIDDVVLGYDHDNVMQVIRDHAPHVLLFGYDQASFVDCAIMLREKGEADFIVVWAKPFHPHIYKSSIIDENLKK